MSSEKVLGKVMGNRVTKSTQPIVIGTREKYNLELYLEFKNYGFRYIYNPATNELHKLKADKFKDSDNLEIAHLEKFIAIWDLKGIYWFEDGREAEVLIHNYDKPSEQLGIYKLDKCKVCFPP